MDEKLFEDESEKLHSASDLLKQFIITLPLNDRNHVTSILLQLRRQLQEIIPPKAPIKTFVSNLQELRITFCCLPLFVRQKLKVHLFNGLQASLNGASVPFAIFTICLCLLELSAIRNVDRLDLESEDVWETISHLNSDVLPKLSDYVSSQRTNIATLYTWAFAMLVFSFHACAEWLYCQRCLPQSVDSVKHVLQFDRKVLEHASIPVVMQTILKLQYKQRPFPVPSKPYTLFDLLFSCAISGNYEMLNRSKSFAVYDSNTCPLEVSESCISQKPRLRITDNSETHIYLLTEADMSGISHAALEIELQTGSFDRIVSILRYLKSRFMPQSSAIQDELKEQIITTLRCTTHILARFQSECTKQHPHSVPNSVYEDVFCLLVQLWYQATEQRMLLVALPQSYLWLAGLMGTRYALMSQTGFVRASVCLSRFLTSYQSLFRSTIWASPHWYLQLITDVILAVIERLEEAQTDASDYPLEEAMCSCIVAISRPFSALNADDSTVRPELSRVVKTPLEIIVSRIASCKPHPTGLQEHTVNGDVTVGRPVVLGVRIRELLTNYLLLPLIRACDPWALGQIRIGIKPVSAKILFNQLLIQVDAEEEAHHVTSKLDLPVAPVAVGGLHVTEKLSVKRRRR
ncbi:hypothetical protein EG68_06840 [Paragonimus skrjabini miyazakii]|uniref:Uncharacterized protein n=1 Tax=Paragonimus skrjabini miyazakii TaxID=59628 RepID=A0A8S9YC84_9TREM|nr:hypothetical protein EG68_06840 [Paragonimus skrjabini miyazakii]